MLQARVSLPGDDNLDYLSGTGEVAIQPSRGQSLVRSSPCPRASAIKP